MRFPPSFLKSCTRCLRHAWARHTLRARRAYCPNWMLRKLADWGVPWAIGAWATRLRMGFGVPRDPDRAFTLLFSLAKRGNRRFKAALLNDPALPDNLREAWFAELENGTDVAARQARYLTAAATLETPTGLNNPQAALPLIHACIAEGNPWAENLLGYCLLLGYGVPKDETEALRWFRSAARCHVHYALYNLGRCYLFGLGVAASPKTATRWLAKAARWGNDHARFLLGRCRVNGYGIRRNPDRGLKEITEAAVNHGLTDAYVWMATDGLELLYPEGGAQLPPLPYLFDQLRAIGAPCMEAVEGRWCGNPTVAIQRFRAAAEAGDAYACRCLCEAYREGKGVPQSHAESLKWAIEGANRGDRTCCYWAGIALLTGLWETTPIPDEGLRWLWKAARDGEPNANLMLRRLFDRPAWAFPTPPTSAELSALGRTITLHPQDKRL